MSSMIPASMPQGDRSQLAQSVTQTEPVRETLPTMYDLPSEFPEEPGLPDEFHDLQPHLLSRTLRLTQYARENYFTGTDLNVYYNTDHPLWHKRPDWFLVVNVPRLYDGHDSRLSYVVWQEGKCPDVIVEFLSPGTEKEDLGRFYDKSAKVPDNPSFPPPPQLLNEQAEEGTAVKPPKKFELYERILQVPHYIVYSRYTGRLRYFKLIRGQYQEQSLNPENPRIWLDGLEVGLGIWTGMFDALPGQWLRWCDRSGNWFLTDTEQANLEREQANLEREQANLEREQARSEQEQIQAQLIQAARNLLATGMTIDQVTALLSLTEEQIRSL